MISASDIPVDTALIFGATFVGLFLGKALNMVVSHLPNALHRQWDANILQSVTEAPATTVATVLPLRIQCPNCQTTLRTKDSFPIVSFALLGGKCRDCSQRLSWREPLVEMCTGLLLAACALRWGASWQAVTASCFSCSLLTLALIDWDTSLLPDVITQPLVWGGLVVSGLGINHLQLEQSLAGAVLGYAFLWFPHWIYKLLTGKEGMGHGDFKLTAAIGAWLGTLSLMPVILIATLTGACFGVIQKIRGSMDEQGYFPFGPFLALAGLLVLFSGF